MDLDGDPSPMQVERVAVLLSQLPRESRLVRAEVPDALWGDAERLLWQLEYDLRALQWQLGRGKGKRPKPLPTPGETAENDKIIRSAVEHQAQVTDALLAYLPDKDEEGD